MRRQRFEAVTVCVGYDDFLRETLPHNAQHFDSYLVVTSFEDRATIDLCKHLSIDCRPTDLFKHGGDIFAKGRAVDWGLGFLRKDGWVAHIDADTWLPPYTRHWLDRTHLDEEAIYGVDRFNCVGYEAWQRYQHGIHQQPQHRIGCLLVPPPFPLGARFALPEHAGYLPIGFFQLWHSKHNRRYPMIRSSCEHDDVLHALQWPTGKRHLIEELFAVHLESDGTPGSMGANWNGRTTPRFGPPPPPPPCHTGYKAH